MKTAFLSTPDPSFDERRLRRRPFNRQCASLRGRHPAHISSAWVRRWTPGRIWLCARPPDTSTW
jgi:hypothetical protein